MHSDLVVALIPGVLIGGHRLDERVHFSLGKDQGFVVGVLACIDELKPELSESSHDRLLAA
ncbi:MAG TPA: hypothetical protein VK273_07390 [Gaiellaceae bacterium]|nr:hypothetical protein [Gaiellaceae bacterium]